MTDRNFRSLRAAGAAPRLPVALAALALLCLLPAAARAAQRFPNILLVTVDTLRADRLSAYGYERPTSPHIDRLLTAGALFTEARTVEPLTGPASCSMLTSVYPHEHGASRNSLAIRPGLASLPKRLEQRGYTTAAFVGNWTLRDKLTGLAEHFDLYQEVVSRRRWFGLFNSEATGEDVTDDALEWLDRHAAEEPHRPFFLWVHYVEPHAPYRLQKEFAPQLGIPLGDGVSRPDRYDTEIAFVDHQIDRFLRGAGKHSQASDTLVVFAADHGESLGEHGYWGHGRHLWEPSLRIPLGFTWPGKITPGRRVTEKASLLDIAPTVLGLVGLPPQASFRGFDWSGVLTGTGEPPAERVMLVQAHKGAVLGDNSNNRAREGGLIEVGLIRGTTKELLDLRQPGKGLERFVYDLAADPRELRNLSPTDAPASEDLNAWLRLVQQGLERANNLPAAELDAETLEKLRALGYID
jgi:arylsulfatase A-like enzyme